MSDDGRAARGSRNIALAALTFVYTLNYIDRQIISILASPIKAELELSDTELGVMGGLAFAIFYSTLGIPIARLADRFSRRNIITAALCLWSGFTALCGAATGFWSLFLARLGVGVGEAGGIAPSFSLVADLFPPHQRARALAVLTLALPVGSAAGLLIGGLLAAAYGWRSAFVVMGVVGLLAAPLLVIAVREPERGRLDPAPVIKGPAPSLFDVFRLVRVKPSFWLVSLGSAGASMLSYGLQFWLPAFLQRTHGLDLKSTAYFLGAIAFIGGVSGTLLGGVLSDRFGARDRRAYVIVPGLAFLIALPILIAALWVQSIVLVFLLLLIPQAMGLVWTGPSVAVVQHLAPPSMRATASSIYLLILNLIGLGTGTLVFGAMSDLLASRFGTDALRYALLICATGLYPLTAAFYLLAARSIRHDWHHAGPVTDHSGAL